MPYSRKPAPEEVVSTGISGVAVHTANAGARRTRTTVLTVTVRVLMITDGS
ncbi:MAG TPA: hypothetical protein VF981_01655 [Gemmatimonadaceae bacterium]